MALFLESTEIPVWLYLLVAIVPVAISIFVFCRQNKIMKQQNDIALFDKRYELYTAWLKLLSASYNLLMYTEEILEENIKNNEQNKMMLTIKAFSILFSCSVIAQEVESYESKEKSNIEKLLSYEDYYRKHDYSIKKEKALFYDYTKFMTLDHEDCYTVYERKVKIYNKVKNDVTDYLYQLRKIQNIFKLSSSSFREFTKIYTLFDNIFKLVENDEILLEVLAQEIKLLSLAISQSTLHIELAKKVTI